MISTENQSRNWDDSYKNKDNYLFYPNEEVIRYFAKHIKKRVGLREFNSVCSLDQIKVFDLGCGIGRHVIYSHEMEVDGYGLDISLEAIKFAREWLSSLGVGSPSDYVKHGDATNLPWGDNFFDFALSHGVLDSMPFDVAKNAVGELYRVIKPSGYFYCDLISGDDQVHSREFSGEETVITAHEEGTIQSYFNFEKIRNLFDKRFEIVECQLVRHENVLSGFFHSRYYVIVRRF